MDNQVECWVEIRKDVASRQLRGEIFARIPQSVYQYLSWRIRECLRVTRQPDVYVVDWYLVGDHFTHKDLYEAIGFSYGDQHHPRHNEFFRGCDGFLTFLKEIENNNEVIRKVADVIANWVTEIIRRDYIEGVKASNFKVQTKMLTNFHPPVEKTVEAFPEVEVNNPMFFVTPGGVYQVILAKTNIKTLEELQKEAQNVLKNVYESMLEAKTKTLKNEIELLKKRIEELKAKALKKAIELLNEAEKLGWKYENGKLVWDRYFRVEKVTYKGKIYDNPFDFYVEKIEIKLTSVLDHNGYVYNRDVRVIGKHPNVDVAKHPCLGDLEGKPLSTVLAQIVKFLKHANLDSPYWNPPEDDPGWDELENGIEIWKTGDEG